VVHRIKVKTSHSPGDFGNPPISKPWAPVIGITTMNGTIPHASPWPTRFLELPGRKKAGRHRHRCIFSSTSRRHCVGITPAAAISSGTWPGGQRPLPLPKPPAPSLSPRFASLMDTAPNTTLLRLSTTQPINVNQQESGFGTNPATTDPFHGPVEI